MRIVFMGTPEFALPALERLIDSRHEVVLVITQPDRPRGRGRQTQPSPVKEMALAHGLKVIQPVRVRKEPVAEAIRQTGADLGVVAAFGQILPQDVLDAPRLGVINIHPSMLPEYRGAAPIQRCLLDGRRETGVSLMMLVQELDAGPVVAQLPLEILDDDDAQSVAFLAAAMGADMLLRVIDEAEQSGAIEAVAQDPNGVTYAGPIRKEEGLIPWDDSTDEILIRIRGMVPWPGTYCYIDGKRLLHITKAEPLWPNEAEEIDKAQEWQPGFVSSILKGFGFTVKTGDGHLLVTRVRPSGGKEMEAPAFINGRGIAVGDWLAGED